MQKDSREVESGEGRIVLIKSFTSPDLTYRVNVTTLECSCKRFRFTGTCQKHILLATAKDKLKVRFGRDAAEEHLESLVRRIYSPMSVQESYRVFTEAIYSPFATEAVRNTAQRRHLGLVGRAA